MSQRLNYDAEQLLLNGVRETAVRFASKSIEPEHLLLAILEKYKLKECFDSDRSRQKLTETLKKSLEAIRSDEAEHSVPLPPSPRYLEFLTRLSEKISSAPEDFCGDVFFLFRTAAETEDSLCRPFIANGRLFFPSAVKKQTTERIKTPKELEEEKRKNDFLLLHTKEMVAQALAGDFDPIVGREKEIERMIKILSRRRKNNPLLLGEAGVGKTALVEGLAQRIADGTVPDGLEDKKILRVDMGSILAGTKYRGEFEDRLKKLLQIVMERKNIILFIDEIHNIVGAGASEGAIDAVSILKPPLSRGDFQCIGATTVKEYRRWFESDAALIRRFQNIYVEEPDEKMTMEILQGIVRRYGEHHQVVYTHEALETAVFVSNRYLTDRFQPDKAIDLIDEAGAEKRMNRSEKPKEILNLEEKIQAHNLKKNRFVEEQRFEKAAKERDAILRLKSEKTAAEALWKNRSEQEFSVITTDDILHAVSVAAGIPAEKLAESEMHRLLHLEEELKRIVVGQEAAVAAISSAIRRSRVGLTSQQRPTGSFLFLGPTGVGKTYLAKTLADKLFGTPEALIRIDMSDYMEKHNVSKLVGAPPGFVGFEDGGILSGAVRRRPYCVVLLDEIEKAHPDVFHLLLQVLEEGELIDSHGHKVSFRNAVIIMTSNLGSKDLNKDSRVGFSTEKGWKSYSEIKQSAMAEAKRFLSPEFINRLDEIVVFDTLKEPQIREIVDLLCSEIIERMKNLGIRLKIDAAVRDELVKTGFDPAYGARTMRRALRTQIEDSLAMEILTHPEASAFECRRVKGKIVFRVTAVKTEDETQREHAIYEL